MANLRFNLVFFAASLLASPGFSAMTPEQASQLPPPAAHAIDFSKEIKPIFEASCIRCHGRGRTKGDFRLDTRETLLKGGESGPALLPGRSTESRIVELVMGFDPDSVMPKKGSRLTPEQVGLLRAWIDQGAKWDAGVSFARAEPNNLKPRRPVLPASTRKGVNPVDLLLEQYFKAHNIKAGELVDDRTFARRVYLDILGLLPSPEELQKFISSKAPDKRRELARVLLADNRDYAVHWLTFWNDALRNDYRGTGYIDGGRKQITQWLYSALERNMPYDRFVSQLINPRKESEGFVKGIVWRGVVNASQTPQMQAAQNISQVFMGVNLKCASCHDSFINDWMLADAYGLAGVYADKPLEMVHCDKPTGQEAALKFIYPQLGEIDPQADKTNRLRQLAELICQRPDGRLTRTLVNRLWQKFLGRGLVEPVDEMEKEAWNPDVLDWLAEDFVDHNYDVKHLIGQIVTSQAYQMSSVPDGEQDRGDFVFRGPVVRRMTAEEFRDALLAITGIGGSVPAGGYDFLSAFASGEPATSSQGSWIWNDPGAALKTKPGTVFFRKIFVLDQAPAGGGAVVACDDSFTLYINGQRVGSGAEAGRPMVFDLAAYLRDGTNLVAISAENKAAQKKEENKDPQSAATDTFSPAGLFFSARVRVRKGHGSDETALGIFSDATWVCSGKSEPQWEKPDFSATGWEAARELGGPDVSPWKAGHAISIYECGAAGCGRFRAATMNADALTTALGRPNREQVMTSRTSAATTLQALELTNGAELSDLMQRGAAAFLAEPRSPRETVDGLYLKSLGRQPTEIETALAMELVGNVPSQAGVADLMWSLVMLPEFQLIY